MLDIAQASASDVAEVIGLRHAAEDWLAARGIRQWTPRQIPESVILRQIDAGEFFVARLGGQPVIAGALRLIWSDAMIWQQDDTLAAYVHSLVVARNRTGIGLGGRLLAWAARTARPAGVDRLRLDCAATNPGLGDYYRRAGFHQVGWRDLGRSFGSVALFERRLNVGLEAAGAPRSQTDRT
jgi:GNAT superfamily N-acetyltransferase